jgi:cation transport regulator ChaB
MKKKIKSIEEELADCRAAFAQHPNAKLVWMCHHEVLIEPLTNPFEHRINYILINKPENERAVRLRNFRPVKNEAAVKSARDVYWAAVKPAQEVYWAATKSARDANDAAVKSAEEVYWAAIKAPQQPLVEVLDQEYPNNTWNGDSIFNK